MSIRVYISILVTTCALSGIALAYVLHHRHHTIDRILMEVSDNSLALRDLEHLESDMQSGIAILNSVFQSDATNLAAGEIELMRQLGKSAEVLADSKLADESNLKDLKQIQTDANAIIDLIKQAESYDGPDRTAHSQNLAAAAKPHTDAMLASVEQITQRVNALADERTKTFEDTESTLTTITVLCIVVFLGILAAMWWWIVATFNKPMQDLIAASEQSLSMGKPFGLEPTGPTETRQLAATVARFIESLEQKVLDRTQQIEQRTNELEREINDRERIERALRESREHLQGIYNTAGDGIIVIDPGAETIVDSNERAIAMLGYPEDILKGMKVEQIHPHEMNSVRAFFEVLNTQMTGFSDQPSCRTATGAVVPAEISASKWQRDDGDLVVAMVRDTTHRKQVENELIEAKDAAEAASLAKSQFLANMSHEIRTPITAIMGYGDLLYRQSIDRPQEKTWLRNLQSAAQHLLAVVNDVLDLSKIEAGGMMVDSASTPLLDLLEAVTSLLRPKAREKDLALNVVFETPIPRYITTDAVRFRQILINLGGNAIKFTEQGSVSFVIGVDNTDDKPESRMLYCKVADTGIGMNQEQLAKLFSPFTQVHDTRTNMSGGTGLGLVISRRFAQLMGGDVTVESEKGKGTTFLVTMNIPPVEDEEMISPDDLALCSTQLLSPNDATKQDLSLDGCHILLADDFEDSRYIIRFMLEDHHAKVTLAENGKQAADAVIDAQAKGTPFDLVLMDMQMPVMNGYEATTVIRKQKIDTPIVALTAFAMPTDRQRCLDAGCTDYATKPIIENVFFKTISKYVGKWHDADSEEHPHRKPLPGIDDPVNIFRRSLSRISAEVEIAWVGEDYDNIDTYLEYLIENSKSAGFLDLHGMATNCRALLESKSDYDRLNRSINELVACMEKIVEIR